MCRVVYVNGSYVPEEQGKISIFDRSFLFADGIYEVTAVVRSKLVDYDSHMERLERSLREIRLDWPCSKEELKAMHLDMVKRNSLDGAAPTGIASSPKALSLHSLLLHRPRNWLIIRMPSGG